MVTMSVQNTLTSNMAQPKSQEPLLNSHQNQRFAAPATGGGFGLPGNNLGHHAQLSNQQPPPVYMNRGPAAKNEVTPRIIPIAAMNVYLGSNWSIKARVTAKTALRNFNKASGPGKVFNFDLLDAQGGEIRAVCFSPAADQFYGLIDVGKVYLISRGNLKPANKNFSPLNHDCELHLEAYTSVQICPDDDSSIPRLQYNFRQIIEIENIDNKALVDLVGVVTSVSPSVTSMRKDGSGEFQKRTLQLKDMSGRSVEITMWGNFCDTEGQQLQLQRDSGSNPVLALKSGRVTEYNGGKSVSTISTSQFSIDPDFPEAERLREWYMTEGKTAGCISLSWGTSNTGKADVRKTIAQIKDENLGRSDKPDWITVKAAISHVYPDPLVYPACTLTFNEKQCNKKVTNNGDGTWHCERCDKTSEVCEYRYLLSCNIQDHTGTTIATAFQEGAEQIVGRPAGEVFSIKNDDPDYFAEILQGIRWHLCLFKLRIKEETFNDESRVKCIIVDAKKLNPSEESQCVLRAIDILLQDGSGSVSGINGAVGCNSGFTNSEVGQSMLTSNNAYSVNTGGANQFGQQASNCGRASTPLSVTRNEQTCSICGSSGHNTQNCPAGMDVQQPPAGGGFTGNSYGMSAGNTSSDNCYKCNQPGHWAKDCPGQATGPKEQTYAHASSGGFSGSSYGISAGNTSSGTCFNCNQPGHWAKDCPGQATGSQQRTYVHSTGLDRQQPPAGGGFSGRSYGTSAGNTGSGTCFRCNQPGHWAKDCPTQATGPQQHTYGNGAASGGYNRQSFVGGY